MKNSISFNELKRIEFIELIVFKENAYNLEELEYLNTNNSYKFFLIKECKDIIAYAITQETIDFVEIIKIATLPNVRKKKYGSNILNKICKDFKKDIYIDVSDRDYTKNFYLKNGFVEINFRKNYYSDSSNCIRMIFKNNNIL